MRRFTAKVNCALRASGEVPKSPPEVDFLTRNEPKGQGDTQPGSKAEHWQKIGDALAVPQDLTDMAKAGLPELQCPGVFMPSEGKAYLMVVGEVMARGSGLLIAMK